MILAILFLLLSAAAGGCLLRLPPIAWYKAEFVFGSIMVGLFAGTWSLLLTSWAFGYTAGYFLTAALLVAVCLLTWQRYKKSPLPTWIQPTSRTPWLIVTIAATALFGWLMYTHMLQVKDGAYYSAGSTWGDLALHVSLISRFAQQAHLTLDFPIFAEAKLSYPFLVDFLSGMLHRFGLNLQMSLLIPGILLSVSLGEILFFFITRVTKDARVATLALLLFFISGGPGGISVFWRDWQSSGSSLFTFLGSMTKQYSNLWTDGIYFSNIIDDYILPQRGILFGLGLFGIVCTLLHQAWQHKKDAQNVLWAATLVTVLIPLAHTHTFFVLWGLIGFLALVQAIRQKTLATPWTQTLLIASVMAAPQISWQLCSNFNDSFTRWQFGWMKKPDENILLFWLRNMGAPFIFLFTNFWFIKGRHSQDSWHVWFYTPLIILFAATNLYIFQPHNYDNMKFMVFAYLAICIYMSWSLVVLMRSHTLGRFVAAAAIITTCAVGGLSIARETYTSWQFTPSHSISLAEQCKALSSPDAIVLTSDQHNHFIPTLTGRRILMGYRGWLWTYGINYTNVESDIRAMLAGSPLAPSLLKTYDVSFVVIGPSELNDFNANTAYYNQHGRLVLQAADIRIYDVRTFSLQ